MQIDPPFVLLSAFYKPFFSGAEKCVEELLKRPAGRRLVVITTRGARDLPVRDKDQGMEIIRVGFGCSWDKYFFPLLCLYPALHLRPRVVHAVMESYAGAGLMLLKWLRPRLKTILTLQSGNLDEDAKLQKGLRAWVWRRIHSQPDEITAISRFLANRASRIRGSADHVRLIPNGVDLSLIRAQQQPSVPGKIVCIARLSPEKGVDVLIRAFARVCAIVPEARLHLIGDGPQRAELESVVKQGGCEKTVVFHGRLAYEAALRELASGSVFALLSHGEGQGIVLLEAGACGIPSVATAVGGIPEMVQDGVTGFLVPDADVSLAAKKMILLLQDASTRQRMGEAARAFADAFSWDRCIAEYHSLWNELEIK